MIPFQPNFEPRTLTTKFISRSAPLLLKFIFWKKFCTHASMRYWNSHVPDFSFFRRLQLQKMNFFTFLYLFLRSRCKVYYSSYTAHGYFSLRREMYQKCVFWGYFGRTPTEWAEFLYMAESKHHDRPVDYFFNKNKIVNKGGEFFSKMRLRGQGLQLHKNGIKIRV